MKKLLTLLFALMGITQGAFAVSKSLEWVREVDREALKELDSTLGDYESLQHHLSYAKKIKLPYRLSGVLVHGENRGYCLYELSSRRCVILASFGKKAGMSYETEGLKSIGWQMLRNSNKGKTQINFVFGRIYEIIDENYSIRLNGKNNTQVYKGNVPK